MRITRY